MIAVIDYGIGNLGSAHKALKSIGAETQLVDSPEALDGITGMVLPGVGSFGACVTALRSTGLDSMVLSGAERGIPLLGVCVGMQMLYEGSEESPGVAGLGLLGGQVRRLSGAPKIPHMSWNQVRYQENGFDNFLFKDLPELTWFYFVHSYAPELTTDTIATCSYGRNFTAVVAKGEVFGTQFHPEKSSKKGLMLLSNFAEHCNRRTLN